MMKKTLEVIRYELVSALTRPSFLFFAFGLPVVVIVAFAAYSFIKSGQDSGSDNTPNQEENQLEVEGYIDLAGIIEDIPEDLPPDLLVEYFDEPEAQFAMEAGKINAYYVIPDNYLETGDFYYIHPDINPISEGGQPWVMRWTLYVNLLDGDMDIASHIWNPANFSKKDLSVDASGDGAAAGDCLTPGYSCESNILIQLLPLGVMVIIYVSILSGGSYLMRLITIEKDNRVMELLILSASPRQLLNGKIVSYSLLGFVQVLAWLGTIFLVLKIGGTSLNLPPGFVLPISLLVWGLVFYLFGFAIYASLMAGAGALTPKLSQYTSVYFIVSMPLMLTYAFSLVLARIPHSTLAVVLSIFPLSAPVMMITRLTVGGVPTWQPIVASVLSLLTAILIIRAVGRMFHAQLLLSGQPFSITKYIKVLLPNK
jgi:ABC-2 type transport system permease protein